MKKLSASKRENLEKAIDQVYIKSERLFYLMGEYGIGNEYTFTQSQQINEQLSRIEKMVERFSE
jgi:hypothetical protein